MESQVAFVSPNAFTNAGVALPASGPKSPNTCAAAARKRGRRDSRLAISE